MSTATPPPAQTPAPMTDAERRKMIKERQKTSVFWATVHIFGSLKFAVILLLIIAASVAVATFIESDFDTAIAHYYIYDAWWLTIWLIALVVNLAAAALTRWPWQSKHTGFVITHAGIIILLIGGLVGQYSGFEAFLTLEVGQEPAERLTTRSTVLRIVVPDDNAIYEKELPVEVLPPSEDRPRDLPLPGSRDVRLFIDGFTESLTPVEKVTASPDPNAPAGVQLRFDSLMMGQEIDVPLMLGTNPDGTSQGQFDFFTLASINLLPKLPEAVEPKGPALVSFQEGQVILAKHPESPIITSSLADSSGYRFALSGEGAAPDEVIVRLPDETEKTYALAEARTAPQALPGGLVTFQVTEYWPDFAVRDNQPTTLSDEPNNPAMLVQLRGMMAPVNVEKPKPEFLLAPAAEGGVAYRLLRNGEVYDEGTLAAGDRLPLGWADWHATIETVEPHAGLRREVKVANAPVNPTVGGAQMSQGVPGIRARLSGPEGTSGEPVWIMAGTGQNLFHANELVQVGFGRKTIPIPFNVTLDKFEVPRDEGTDTPADFISSLRFTGADGEVVRDEAHMNSPAMFPGGFWRSVMGWNYKFSQAHWDPQNLNETSLQVLYDPGWPLKWFGSLLICTGIAIMFYFKPYSKKRPKEGAT